MEWQKIETAPKDGTRILMWDSHMEEVTIAQWGISEPSIISGNRKCWVTDSQGGNPDNSEIENPKFWAELPAPPRIK